MGAVLLMYMFNKLKRQHYMRSIKLTEHITLVIFGYTSLGKDYNKFCHLQFKNGEIYPII